MDEPKPTKTAVLPWGYFYLMCSFLFCLALVLIGLNALQKPGSEGLVDILVAAVVLLQGIILFMITRTLDVTNKMCAYLVEVAEAYEREKASGSYKAPWACPICQQQNNYWDEKCIKCGQRR
jgi:hypothetical protein